MRADFRNIICLIASLCACPISVVVSAADISQLRGRWTLKTIDEKSIPRAPEIFFQIDGETITGYDGCNRFGGSLTQPFLIRKTQRACASDATLLPLDLSNPLAQLNAAMLSGDQLVLPLPAGRGQAKFRRT